MIDPTGWHVALDNTDADTTFTPDPIGDPERQPSLLNAGLPEVRLPVSRDEKWQDPRFDEAPMRVYKDGQKQPIEELDRTRLQNGQAVLIGQGGRDLLERVQLSVGTRRIHTLIEELISNNTSYTPHVTVPRNDTDEAVVQQNPDTTAEWSNSLDIPSDKPLTVENGTLKPQQTAVLLEAEQFGPQGGGIAVNSNASEGEEAVLDGNSVGQWYEFTFTPQYDVPSGASLPLLRIRATGPDPPGFKVEVDGTEVYRILSGGFNFTELTWLFEELAGLNGTPPAVSAGDTVTVRIEVTESGSDDINVDLGGWADGRFEYTFDNTVDSDGYLTGPQEYPDAVTQAFETVTTTQAITAARWQSEQVAKVEFSVDGGTTYPYSATDTAAFTQFLDNLTTTLTARVTLDRTATSRNETPRDGQERQTLDTATVSADLSNIPIVANRRFDDDLLSVLQTLLQQGDMLAEFRDDGTKTIEVAQPGQRVNDSDITVSNYEVTKEGTTYQKAVVEGAAKDIDGEPVTVSHDTAVDLTQDALVPASERVSDGGTTYVRDDDYELDYQDGTITALSSGSITDGATVSVDYRYKVTGSATADGVSSPNRTFREDIPGLTTQRAADQAAKILVRNLQEPRYEATVTLPAEEAGWRLIDDLDPPEVPTGGKALEVEDVQAAEDGIRLRLGSRDSAQEVVGRIQSRLSAVGGRV